MENIEYIKYIKEVVLLLRLLKDSKRVEGWKFKSKTYSGTDIFKTNYIAIKLSKLGVIYKISICVGELSI